MNLPILFFPFLLRSNLFSSPCPISSKKLPQVTSGYTTLFAMHTSLGFRPVHNLLNYYGRNKRAPAPDVFVAWWSERRYWASSDAKAVVMGWSRGQGGEHEGVPPDCHTSFFTGLHKGGLFSVFFFFVSFLLSSSLVNSILASPSPEQRSED